MATRPVADALQMMQRLRQSVSTRLAYAFHRFTLGSVELPFTIEPNVEIRTPEQVRVSRNVLIKGGTIINGRSSSAEFGVDFGPGTYIKGYSYIDAYGGYLCFKGDTNISQFCLLAGQGGVTVGRYVMFGSHCCLLSSNHVFADLELPYMCQGDVCKETIIEDNVWIGAGSIVLPGITVGRNSVVGAGSLVLEDVPANSLFVNKRSPCIVRHLNAE